MFSVAIVEDDEDALLALKNSITRYVKEINDTITINSFNNAEKFLSGYKPIYDVVFMDIQLGHMNGMDAAAHLRKFDENVNLIFVTNMVQFAIQAYKVNALDYFVKPFSYYDLKLRMERIRKSKENKLPNIIIPLPNGIKSIRSCELLYIEIMNHTLTYHTTDGNHSVRGESLSKLEKTLSPSGFARCSASYLVNLSKCRELVGNVVSIGDDELQISRGMQKEFINRLSEALVYGGRQKA